VASPSIAGKLMENKQDVCFSDDATWMSHRNDSNFPKRARETKPQGRLSFAYFSFIKAIHGFYPSGSYAVQIAPAICGEARLQGCRR